MIVLAINDIGRPATSWEIRDWMLARCFDGQPATTAITLLGRELNELLRDNRFIRVNSGNNIVASHNKFTRYLWYPAYPMKPKGAKIRVTMMPDAMRLAH